MKISIITPSYNQGAFLEQTIDSVLSQSYSNLEYIVIDGGSTDGSVDIIKKYEKYLAYWVSEPDSGQSHAINKGIRKASGNIINWLNSDDYYTSDTLKTLSVIMENPSVNCVCGRSNIIEGDETVRTSQGTDVYEDNLAKTIGWARIDQPETFFKKEVWDKVGLLNEQLHFTMDREWWMRYLYLFGLEGIKESENILVNFRLHDSSKTMSQGKKFEIEHDTLFYLMASSAKSEIVERLLSKVNQIDQSVSSVIEKWSNQEIVEQSLNYYFLKRADELYYADAAEASIKLLSLIQEDSLSKEDRKLAKMLKFKTKVPLPIIHFFRKK